MDSLDEEYGICNLLGFLSGFRCKGVNESANRFCFVLKYSPIAKLANYIYISE